MSGAEQYPDPVVARRVKAWIDDTAPPAAPERLVFSVMDEVESTVQRRTRLSAIRLDSVLQYVALTVVIAIGVAAGTLLTRSDQPSSASPLPTRGASPSPSATATLEAPPSLPAVGRRTLTNAPGPGAIGVTAATLWIGTPNGTVVEIDAATGDERSRTTVGVDAITIRFLDGLGWIGSGGEDLVWLDPAAHAVGSIPGAGGPFVVGGAGSIWVSRQDGFARVDPRTRTVVDSIAVPGHRDTDSAIVVGEELWVVAGSSTVRLALPSGEALGPIDAHPSGLLTTPRGVLGIEGGRLMQFSDASDILERPIALLDGLHDPTGAAVDGDRLWLIGGVAGGADAVVEIDLSGMRIASRTPLSGGGRAIAVAAGSVWIAVDNGELIQFRANP
jgi:hypothetical protein